MAMQPCSQTFNPYFLRGGRIINCYGEHVFTDRIFADAIDADYWLNFVNHDAQFGTAYIETDESKRGVVFVNNASGEDNHRIASRHNRDSQRQAARRKSPLTIKDWQVRNGLDPTKPLDPELYDALPY